MGHFDGGKAAFAGFGQPFGIGDQHDLATARADFLHVADGFFEQRPAGREDDHRHSLIDQGNRAVLHLAAGIAFGVDIADFLEFQRAFKREGIIGAATQLEHIARLCDQMGHRGDIFIMRQRGVQCSGCLDQVADDFAFFLCR